MSASGSPGPVPLRATAIAVESRVPNQAPRMDSLSIAARCEELDRLVVGERDLDLVQHLLEGAVG
eukprot:723845-Lingulodinium_polyedra.AAC.1